MPRTIEQGLTAENLCESIDEVLRGWSLDDWEAFLKRYLDVQFDRAAPGPKASIPARADDDDLILGRIVDLAREAFVLRLWIVRIADAQDHDRDWKGLGSWTREALRNAIAEADATHKAKP